MTRLNRRRLISLLAPIPLLGIAVWTLKAAPITDGLKLGFQMPAICIWHFLGVLGIKSHTPALLSCAAYWYLLLSLGSYSVLCPRDRLSKAMLICVLATSTLIFAGWVFGAD